MDVTCLLDNNFLLKKITFGGKVLTLMAFDTWNYNPYHLLPNGFSYPPMYFFCLIIKLDEQSQTKILKKILLDNTNQGQTRRKQHELL